MWRVVPLAQTGAPFFVAAVCELAATAWQSVGASLLAEAARQRERRWLWLFDDRAEVLADGHQGDTGVARTQERSLAAKSQTKFFPAASPASL